jgi:murein DD-endopeptidase MepM/ murein hydrolase activator NlpD
MRLPSTAVMMIATLVVGAGIVVFVLNRATRPPTAAKIGFQDSAQPLGMPENGEIDHRFQAVGAWTMARIPKSPRWDVPMGSEHGALTYNAQKFFEPNPERGGPHHGDDLNGIGGMNTDRGDPIFAAADGLVLYAGEPSPGWGNTVILAHRTEKEGVLHTMYAHLDRIVVAVGSLVARGSRIGTNGTANDNYPAHLHLEVRSSDHIDIGGGYGEDPLNRIDPMATILRLRGAAADDLSPSPLPHALRTAEAWTDVEIKGAENMPGIGDGKKDGE